MLEVFGIRFIHLNVVALASELHSLWPVLKNGGVLSWDLRNIESKAHLWDRARGVFVETVIACFEVPSVSQDALHLLDDCLLVRLVMHVVDDYRCLRGKGCNGFIPHLLPPSFPNSQLTLLTNSDSSLLDKNAMAE